MSVVSGSNCQIALSPWEHAVSKVVYDETDVQDAAVKQLGPGAVCHCHWKLGSAIVSPGIDDATADLGALVPYQMWYPPSVEDN
eukprot:COSAG05_NODE_103_length_19033_cov_99.004278_4_plen_84_part_00